MDGINSYISSINPENRFYSGTTKETSDTEWVSDRAALLNDLTLTAPTEPHTSSPANLASRINQALVRIRHYFDKPTELGVTLEGRFQRVTGNEVTTQAMRKKIGLYSSTNQSRVENRILKWLEYGLRSGKLNPNSPESQAVLQKLEHLPLPAVKAGLDAIKNSQTQDPQAIIHKLVTKHLKQHEADFRFRTLTPGVSPNDAVTQLEHKLAIDENQTVVDPEFLKLASRRDPTAMLEWGLHLRSKGEVDDALRAFDNVASRADKDLKAKAVYQRTLLLEYVDTTRQGYVAVDAKMATRYLENVNRAHDKQMQLSMNFMNKPDPRDYTTYCHRSNSHLAAAIAYFKQANEKTELIMEQSYHVKDNSTATEQDCLRALNRLDHEVLPYIASLSDRIPLDVNLLDLRKQEILDKCNNSLLALQQREKEAHNLRGALHIRLANSCKPDEANKHLRIAIAECEPSLAEEAATLLRSQPRFEMTTGDAILIMKHTDEASSDYRICEDFLLNTTQPDVHWQLGQVYHDKGKLADAAKQLNLAYGSEGLITADDKQLWLNIDGKKEPFYAEDSTRPPSVATIPMATYLSNIREKEQELLITTRRQVNILLFNRKVYEETDEKSYPNIEATLLQLKTSADPLVKREAFYLLGKITKGEAVRIRYFKAAAGTGPISAYPQADAELAIIYKRKIHGNELFIKQTSTEQIIIEERRMKQSDASTLNAEIGPLLDQSIQQIEHYLERAIAGNTLSQKDLQRTAAGGDAVSLELLKYKAKNGDRESQQYLARMGNMGANTEFARAGTDGHGNRLGPEKFYNEALKALQAVEGLPELEANALLCRESLHRSVNSTQKLGYFKIAMDAAKNAGLTLEAEELAKRIPLLRR